MNRKALGFWIGATLLGAGACAHSDKQAQNNNPANSQQPQAVANGQTADEQQAAGNNGAATGAQAGMGATNDTTGTTTPGASDNAGAMGAAPNGSQNPLQQRNDIISNADGSQPGTIQDYSYGELTLTPAGSQQAPKNANVMAIGDNVPVFQGTTRVGTESLVPGTDVRVYYKNPSSGSEKQVTGVDILSPASNQNAAPNSPSNLNQDMNQQNPSDSNGSGTTPDTSTAPGGTAPDTGNGQ